MVLNSFVVMVHKCGCELHHHPPCGIDEAKTLYRDYINKYFDPKGPVQLFMVDCTVNNK